MRSFSIQASLGLAAFLILAGSAEARRNGPPAGVTGGPASAGFTCAICHGGEGFDGSIQILGVPAQYEPSMIYNLTVRIDDAEQAGAGFQLSAEAPDGMFLGTLIASDAIHTQLNPNDPGFIEHNNVGVDNSVSNWAALGNAAEYQIQWQAPATDAGPVTFWAAGNAINDNFSPSGDHIYATSVTAIGPPPEGACCLPDDLCEVTDEMDCSARGGEFTAEAACGDIGACCFNGSCSELAEFCCASTGGELSDLPTCEADLDGDGVDGVCGDACPGDMAKLEPGVCGCGISDADADFDSVSDCQDVCPGQDDTIDADDNSIPDCLQFQAIPTTSTWGLAALTLLLLIAGKLRFGARSACQTMARC